MSASRGMRARVTKHGPSPARVTRSGRFFRAVADYGRMEGPDLTGRTVLVTGSAKGVGRELL
ncbi:hypothetical protein ACFQE6_28765, partial [Natrinema soli]